MLTGKQKRYLRSMAATERAIIQVGKEGISANLIDTLDKALEARELVKVTVLKNCDAPIREIAYDLAAGSNAEIVQSIGRAIIFYRRSKKNLMEL